jgi:hypothetical protein
MTMKQTQSSLGAVLLRVCLKQRGALTSSQWPSRSLAGTQKHSRSSAEVSSVALHAWLLAS